MPNLKPCPLCWSEDIERRVTASSAKIRCRKCGVGISRAYFGEYGSRAEAEKGIGVIVTKLWNRRAVGGTSAPTVEPKKGRWLPHMEEMEDGLGKTHTIQTGLVCSECDDYSCCGGNFCKNCGADMRGEEDGK